MIKRIKVQKALWKESGQQVQQGSTEQLVEALSREEVPQIKNKR